MNRVCAIVVTYQPDLDRLSSVLDGLRDQTDKVVLVDNGSRNAPECFRAAMPGGNLHVLALGENLGIGAALNVGIKQAMEEGFEFCLLMDQDSIATPNMVSTLLAHHRRLVAEGRRVAAIGPHFQDPASGSLSLHVRFDGWRIKRIARTEDGSPIATDYLITSGSLIAMDVLRAVGAMDESLFIDHVDTEWTLRAKAKGYEVFGDYTAVMEHDLGEYRRRIWFLRMREVPIHKPFRYYYIFRNSVLLYKRRYIPWAWRRVDIVRLSMTWLFMALFHPQRWRALKMMVHGVVDGMRGLAGKHPYIP